MGFRQCLPFSWTTLRGKHWFSSKNTTKSNRPVNLHPLFLFWKHGSVCDLEKNQIQNMDLKKARWKNRVCYLFVWYSKREEARLSLLFLNNNDPVFCNLIFSGPYFGPVFWGSQTDPCFQNKNSGCRLTGQLWKHLNLNWKLIEKTK